MTDHKRSAGLVSRPAPARILAAFVGVVALTAGLVLASPATASAGNAQERFEAMFPEAVRARDVDSARKAELAVLNGLSKYTLKRLADGDDSVWFGRSGRMFVVEEAGSAPDPTDPVMTGIAPLGSTFALHSRPGATKTIYLDFDGHDARNSVWQEYNRRSRLIASAFSMDWSASFSDRELEVIQEVWARVAEDYAPFDVDVTTEYPGLAAMDRSNEADQRYGSRVVVTPSNPYPCRCGGVSYVGIFNAYGTFSDGSSVHEYFQPSWVFTDGTGNSPKTIAEAASHEAGHALGLFHDGDSRNAYYAGAGDWAPIMGVGYNRAVTHWSRGEYPDADNFQDDFAVIRSYGLDMAEDPHGDSPETATTLESGTPLSGTILTDEDTDHFTFSAGAGSVAVDLTPVAAGANLNGRFVVRNGEGVVVAESTDTGLGGSAEFDGPGTFHVAVEGVGDGDPYNGGYSGYGSVGRYTLTATFVPGDGSGGGGGGEEPTNTAPVAAAAAVYPTGSVAPTNVTLNGTESYDPDGDSLSYVWRNAEGGVVGTEASISLPFTEPGTYQFSLVVSDGSLSDDAQVIVEIQAPDEPDPEPTEAPSTPLQPGALSTPDGIVVSFTDADGLEDGFVIMRDQWNGRRSEWVPEGVIGELPAASGDRVSFLDTTVEYRRGYRYHIVAVNGVGESAPATTDPLRFRY